jgi:folate-binding protein YgfZ
MDVWFGTLLPADYGDFEAEYQRATATIALVDTNFQAVAEFTGPDGLRFLNAITSGNIRDLKAGGSALGLLLNPQGHILAELRTLALDDRLMVLSPRMVFERTQETLEKFIIMDDVTLTNRTAEFGTLAAVGPAAVALAERFTGTKLEGLPAGAHVEARAGETTLRVLRATSLGLEGVEFLAPRASLAELWARVAEIAEDMGGGRAGYRAIEALRIEQGIAWFGADFDDRVIPHEAGLETSHISYVKGCYTGQEIVERVRSRGQVNRRLAGLAFDGAALPEPGAKLFAGEKDAGWLTSAAFSPRKGCAVGLGYLRREFREPGSRVRADGREGEVISLPIPPAVK